MEPMSFGLAIVAEARTLASSITTRIANYRDGPSTFRTLSDNVDFLTENISQVESILGKFPTVVPKDISVVFDNTFSQVRSILENSTSDMDQSFSKPFAAASSSAFDRVRAKAVRTLRANALRSKMDDLETKIRDASNQLLQLTVLLGNTLKIQEHQEAVFPKLENLAVVEAADDVFRPRANVPALSDAVNLDFDAQDAEGRSANPEGVLKQSVLLSSESSAVTAATGVMKPAYGIVGMAGVGKTVALMGLAHDKDVRFRFPDGILFMTLGQGATVQTVLRELTKVLAITGANKIAAVVEKCTVLRDAVDRVTPWFENRICLFLVDDVWPTNECKSGFLMDLRQILRDSPESRMAISTRSTTIAQCAGTLVKFGARDPLGSASMKMFMAHATSGTSGGTSAELASTPSKSILKILSICAGLPIALAVTGSAVSFLSRTHGDFESACESYAIRLEKKRSHIGDEDTIEGKTLNSCILLSLEYLEVGFLKWKAKHSHVTCQSISDMYTGLCVLENQAWASASVLGRLWRLDEDSAIEVVDVLCGMSLATLHVQETSSDSSKEAGIILHDLQLDFCRRRAIEAKTSAHWHAQLLNGYLKTANHPIAEELNSYLITSFKPRPWWSNAVPEDGYIHSNLSRHLSCAGQGFELAALLLEGRWMELRGTIGGILGLISDFEILDRIFMHLECSRRQKPLAGDMRRQFNEIFKAVQLSWGRMIKGQRAFQFQVCSRLVSLRKSNVIVDAFVGSIEKCTPMPFLLPLNSFFPELDSGLIMEIPVGDACWCVACSPCGRYIAAGAGDDIVVAKASTGDVLKTLRGHKEDVVCLAFVTGSKIIVSGSYDKTVMVWEWESSESPAYVLEGHGGVVTGVAVNSDVGQIISSSLDETVRIWDMMTGAQTCVLPQSDQVNCVAVCGKGEKIAVGLDGGVKVLDSISKDILFEDTTEPENYISCISFSPDGSCFAAGSWDRTVQVWNTETWTKAGAFLEGHESIVSGVCLSADGKHIASSSMDGTIRLWDFESGNCIGVSSKHSAMSTVSFIGDEERLISGSFGGLVRIWGARLGAESDENTYGHTDSVFGVAIRQNVLQVASASRDGTVRLWDTRTGKQIGKRMEGHTRFVRCVSFSPDGRCVVSGSNDQTLRLWDTQMQTQIGGPFEGHTDDVSSVSISHDGLRIVSGSWDETVRVWNAETHEQIGEAFEGHASPVACVSGSADGCQIVSRDFDGKVIIWNRENGFIVWKSKIVESASGSDSTDDEGHAGDILKKENTFQNEISEDEAERIIRSCGQQTPHLWPKCFAPYTAELYCMGNVVYSNLGENTLLADLNITHWTYYAEGNLFAAGLYSGAVVLCKLKTE